MSHDHSVAAMREAGACLQRRDAPAALAVLERAIAADPDYQPLSAFAGLAACQAGKLEEGVTHLRRALELNQGDQSNRTNLTMALLELGRLDEAEAAAESGDSADPRLARARAYFHQAGGRPREAAGAYRQVVTAFPDDFESWNNLGNAHEELKELDPAIDAFRRAIALRPNAPEPRLNAARTLTAAGRDEARRRLLREAVAAIPDNAQLHYELGLAEGTFRDFDRAERAFRSAITRDPHFAPAYFELGMVFDWLNELDALRDLIAFADRNRLVGPEIDFLKAWEMKRRGAFAEALPIAEAAGDEINPTRRNQLLGELYDRLGDPDRAFAAFTAMNAATAEITSDAVRADAADYLAEVRTNAAMMTSAQVAAWTPPVMIDKPAAPIFIAGFPRSGTTLLDTLLMGIPRLHVLEEQPMMRDSEVAMGDVRRLPKLDGDEIASLREQYFDALDGISAPPPDATVVDKFPLHMTRMPLIYRLFPDAKIIFAQRHPCDCLLSCFVSSFQPNRAMTHFQTLDGAATLYDAAFEAWTSARECLPLDVHVVRYENVVEDLEGEMRALLGFLDLPWDDRVLDNRASAARRGHIKTASYAQVTEPIYRHSRGRWERYRHHLAPVLPMLAPWVERLGYSLGG